MSSRLVHVARDGKVLGQYPPEQLPALLDSGHFLESDVCYSELCPVWTPMPQFLKKVEPPRYSKAHREESSEPRSSSRRSHHSKRNSAVMLSGWIAFLLSVSLVIGAGFWIAGLHAEIGRLSNQITEMNTRLDQKEKENQRLLFVSREVAESGVVRGSIILRNEGGKRVAMPGVQVFLFPRRTIDSYLDERATELSRVPAGTSVDGNDFFTTNLPSPLKTTTTDASGRFEFPVTEPGEYVLFTRMNSFAQGAQALRIWFVAFNSQDPLNTLVQINESNYVQQFVPSLMIVDGR